MFESNRFFLFRLVPGKKAGKMDKLPVSPRTLEVFDSTDAAHYVDYQTAKTLADSGAADGVGWSVAPPYFFLDIDGAAEEKGGSWKEIASRLCGLFTGCFVEVSSSGRGLHVIGRYAGPEPEHKKKRPGYYGVDLELYTSRRFVALTLNAQGNPEADGSAGLGWLVANLFAPDAGDVADGAGWTSGPVIDYGGPSDDDELIELMLSSRGSGAAILGGKASVRDLWMADAATLSRFFPSDSQEYDRSAADLALAAHLAFWTGKDCDRILRLIERSPAYRGKWERPDYAQTTILRAVRGCANVYGAQSKPAGMVAPALVTPVHAAPPATVLSGGAVVRDGFQFVGIDQQIELFRGCVYVRQQHKVMIPTGELLAPEQFKAAYGGYIFSLDATNSKVTRNAFEAFTQSLQIKFPQVSDVVFKPTLAPGAIVVREGQEYVNTYTPIQVDRRRGDITPFLDHMKRVLPDERDRLILLSYMAAIVQYPGRKILWCPVLQGVAGNGKTLFSLCVMKAIGSKYTFWPQADDISNKFNSWILGRIFIGVEEIYIPDRPEVLDVLKVLITGAHGIGTQAKGQDQKSSEICANFIMTTNHRDAVKKTKDDRRFAVFYTAQQKYADLMRDGMVGDYFPNLYQWLDSGGFEFVAEFLHTWQIPEAYNPITRLHRAPDTSSTDAVIAESVNTVEQIILEAVEEARPGFAGGWISSVALDRLLFTHKVDKRVPPKKRKEMLEGLGYYPHPHLRDGRANSPSMIDGGAKPRLYIKAGHLAAQMTRGNEILDRYIAAQQISGPDENNFDNVKNMS